MATKKEKDRKRNKNVAAAETQFNQGKALSMKGSLMGLMTLQTFDIKYHSMSISMRFSFLHIV